MAKLSKEEEEQLEALQRKREAPDNDRSERVHYNIDMSDETAVRRAVRAGILPESALDELDDDPNDDGDGKKAKPKADDDDGRARKPAARRKREPEGAPRRRLTGADKWAS